MKNLLLITLIVFTYVNGYSQTFMETKEPWKMEAKDLPSYPIGQLQEIFDFISHSSGMEFRYPQGGCQQRAEMMHMLLEYKKIAHGRVFIFAPIDLKEDDSTKLVIDDPSGLSKNKIIEWPYHVAPCVSVIGSNGNPEIMIVDPALNRNAPLKLNDWFSKMQNASVSKYMIVKPDTYFFYTKNNSTVISGDFYKHEDLPDPNIISIFDNATLERELAINDVAMFVRQKLDEGYSDPQDEIKTLLSSVNSMVALFASQNNTLQLQDGLTMRNLLEKHALLLNQATKYYNDRVLYWISISKDLRKPGKKMQFQTNQQKQQPGRGPQQPQRGERPFEQKQKPKKVS